MAGLQARRGTVADLWPKRFSAPWLVDASEPASGPPSKTSCSAGSSGGGGPGVGVRYLPARVTSAFSGDWYDVVSLHPVASRCRGDIAGQRHRGRAAKDGPGSRGDHHPGAHGHRHRRALHARPRPLTRPSGGPFIRHGPRCHDRNGPRGASITPPRPPAVRAHGARAPRRAARRARRRPRAYPARPPIHRRDGAVPGRLRARRLHRRPRGCERPSRTDGADGRRAVLGGRCRCAEVPDRLIERLRSGEPLGETWPGLWVRAHRVSPALSARPSTARGPDARDLPAVFRSVPRGRTRAGPA